MSRLGEMDTNLMRAPRLQATGEKRVTGKPLHHLDVRDGFFPEGRNRRATATPVAAVAHQERRYPLGRQKARDDGQVAADDGVGLELAAQAAFPFDAAGEHDESARSLVEPL